MNKNKPDFDINKIILIEFLNKCEKKGSKNRTQLVFLNIYVG